MTDKGTENRRRYVDGVRESARQFARELIDENARLGDRVALLEVERERLNVEVEALREQLSEGIAAQTRLRQQLAENEVQRSTYAARYMEVEEQNANLASLYVTSYRLHATLHRQDVLNIIQEVIINLVGSEEIAIFEMDEQAAALRLIEFFGVDPDDYDVVPLGSGAIGRAAWGGELYVAADQASDGRLTDDEGITACIPLQLNGRVIGLIAIFSLLGQKARIEPLDRELFDLLATHAATALYCTSLYTSEPLRVA